MKEVVRRAPFAGGAAAVAGLLLMASPLHLPGFVGVLLPTMMEPQIAMLPWALVGFAVGRPSLDLGAAVPVRVSPGTT